MEITKQGHQLYIDSSLIVNGRPKVPCQLSGRFRGRSIFSPFF